MEKSRSEGVTHSESESGRELAYVDDFKKLIHENPGVIASFLKFDDIAKKRDSEDKLKEGDVFEEGNLKLTITNKVEETDQRPSAFYYKAEIGEEVFFVKSVPGHHMYPEESTGAKELRSMQSAKEILKDEEGVEVIDFQLGYEDKNGHTYFVSKWTEGENLSKFIKSLKPGNPIRLELAQRLMNIQDLLEVSHNDVNSWNMLYDHKKNKIIVFDIHEINGLNADIINSLMDGD